MLGVMTHQRGENTLAFCLLKNPALSHISLEFPSVVPDAPELLVSPEALKFRAGRSLSQAHLPHNMPPNVEMLAQFFAKMS